MNPLVLVALLALVPVPGVINTASPSPEPTSVPSGAPRVLRTIVTVKSSPFCSALGRHFNAAFSPMLANDRTLDGVSTQLDDLNGLFKGLDYAQRFLAVRRRLEAYDDQLLRSLPAMQDEINKLREGEKLTTDPEAAKQMHLTAQELQRAYDKQRAMAIDLQGIVQGLMQYDITRPVPIGGDTIENQTTLPKERKDIKSYLRFDGQRDVIADAENKAVDIAYDLVQKSCVK